MVANTEIQDNNQLHKFAYEDLRRVQSMTLTVTDYPEYANAYEALEVIERALCSITEDIREAIDNIDRVLKETQKNAEDQHR